MGKYKKIIILTILALLGATLFIYLGLTPKNIKFFLPLRINKIIAIVLVAYCIGHSAVIFQTITNNKILTPSVMGLDSLYLFIQTVIVFFFQSKSITAVEGNTNYIISLVLMIIFALVLNRLLFKGSSRNIYFWLLAGMIFGGFFSGLASFMQVMLDPNEFLILQGKMFASFSNVNTKLLNASIFISLICFVSTFRDYKKLDVLSLGPEQAINLGVNYDFLVRKSMIVVAVLIAVATSLVGPITFLGILVVSLARKLGNTYKHKILVPLTVLIGVNFLVYGLFVVERILSMGTTLTVIINFVGGLYFIYFIIKEKNK